MTTVRGYYIVFALVLIFFVMLCSGLVWSMLHPASRF